MKSCVLLNNKLQSLFKILTALNKVPFVYSCMSHQLKVWAVYIVEEHIKVLTVLLCAQCASFMKLIIMPVQAGSQWGSNNK